MVALSFKCAAVFFYKGRHQGLTAFNHDNEGISAFLHVAYVVFAEVTAVEDEAYFFIAILRHLIHHMHKLGDIRYGAGIFLIKQRHPVGLIKGQGKVKDRNPLIILCFALLYEFYVTGITVFIRGVIGNIYPLLMIPSFIPVVKKPYRLFLSDGREEPAYL